MKKIKYFFTTLMLAVSHNLWAQEVEMADTMRSNGKIYVVVAVLSIIFMGIVGFLIYIDRKVTQLENEIKA